MGPTAPNLTNPVCQYGAHEECSHKLSERMSLLGRNRHPMALLCNCPCHEFCPVGRQRDVPNQEWLEGCTCPGSQQLRDIEHRVHQESEARRAREAEVLRNVKVGQGRSAKDIQQDILDSYEAHGYEPPSDFSRWSRFLAAGTARRGRRTVRLLNEVVSGLRAARRWSPGLPDDQEPGPSGEDKHNESELRKMGLAAARYGAVALVAAAGAYFSGGILSVVLAVIAAFFAAMAAWVMLWYIAIDTLIHISRNADRHK
jgi:hypothetical protein